MRIRRQIQTGFTLIEVVMVITITGIIGGIVAMFLRAPIQQYMDVARRAELTDIADTALRRLGRDIRTAVPNSVRLPAPAGSTYIEFLPTRNGGRYRAKTRADGSGNVLTFDVADGSFDIIGTAINFVAGDHIVVGSTQSDGNLPYDTTAAGVLRAYTGATGTQTTVQMNSTALPSIPAELPSQRFEVVDGVQQAVTYACIGTLGALDANQNGQAKLMRYWGYGFNAVQAAPPFAAGASAILADKVSGCTIEYDVPNQRFGLVAITLTLTSGGESVSLYHEIHVNNAP